MSCARRFQVVPGNPSYLLQSPDSRRTPFAEVLRDYNGFEAGHNSINLHPLMELRIENAYYQPGAPRTGLAGYLGTEVARYLVRARGLELVSVQPMKDRPPGSVPVQELMARAATAFRQYRLYYEVFFPERGHSLGSVLLGADSPAELDSLSRQLLHPETVCSPPALHCTVFPQACSVSIEMKVFVNGKAEDVLWGSTLAGIAQKPDRLEMMRLYKGRLRPLRIDASDPKARLLPLLPGDRINWN